MALGGKGEKVCDIEQALVGKFQHPLGLEHLFLQDIPGQGHAGLLPDGEATLNVEGEAWHMVCKDGKATVEPGDPAAAPMLTKMQAQDLMFSPLSRALYPDMPAEWFPISL